MLIPKYNYSSLQRETIGGKRHYCLPDGTKVGSVTTILDKTKSAESVQALNNWRKRVGHQRAAQITTEAANRGTRMHTYLENYIFSGEHKPRPSNPFAWASHAMAQEIIDCGLNANLNEAWAVEAPLYYSGLYAGTTDLVGEWQGKPAIMDFKQANKPKKREWVGDYFLQLCAYAAAHNHMHATDIRTGVIMMCVRPDENDPTSKPQYQEFILEGAEFDHWMNEWWNRVAEYYQVD